MKNKAKNKRNKDLSNVSGENLNKKIGDLGEDIAIVFLEKRGFQIVERNYRTKLGEIDIVAERDGFYYVFEVKTLKIPSPFIDDKDKDLFNPNVSLIKDDGGLNWLKPEMSLTKHKIKKIRSVALKYCMDFDIKEESLKFMAICISLLYTGSRVTKENIISCRVKLLPLFN